MRDRIFAVLMAGGAGTRFWPLSRRARPKQVLPVVGDDPMVRATVRRLEGLVPPERVLVVTGADQDSAIREVLPDVPRENVLLEPCARNTAPCLALAAAAARARDSGALCLCLPADHVVEPAEDFRALAERALARADVAGTLLTFGIRPDRPATGYGYIRAGEAAADGVFRVAAFVEKPDRETAERYVADGGYLWNSGIFAWRADAFLEEVDHRLPEVGAGIAEIARDAAALPRVFPRLPSISVDYGVLEKTDRAEMVPATFRWDDVGSFDALADHLPADADGNRARGDLLALDATGVVSVAPDGHLVAALGVTDLVVVATPDATLVVPRDRVQEVKRIVEELARRGRPELL